MNFKFNNLFDLLKVFSDENKCYEYLSQSKWKDGAFCPYCGNQKLYAFSDGRNFKCSACRKRFSAKVGTIFEDSKIPLQKWFMAIYLITAHKKGISSHQLSRDIGVTQKTAWFMLHRLRHASQTKSFNEPLKNDVEVDETYVGGKEKNKHKDKKTPNTQGRNTKTKTPVVGLVERGGNIRAMSVNDVKQNTMLRAIVENVLIGSNVHTDEFRSYNGIEAFYNHKVVQHSVGQYVKDDCHTNTIEGFWSLFKRGIFGIYHQVSEKHIDRYLTEFTYRYNSRKTKDNDRFATFLQHCGGRLTYQDLIANKG